MFFTKMFLTYYPKVTRLKKKTQLSTCKLVFFCAKTENSAPKLPETQFFRPFLTQITKTLDSQREFLLKKWKMHLKI